MSPPQRFFFAHVATLLPLLLRIIFSPLPAFFAALRLSPYADDFRRCVTMPLRHFSDAFHAAMPLAIIFIMPRRRLMMIFAAISPADAFAAYFLRHVNAFTSAMLMISSSLDALPYKSGCRRCYAPLLMPFIRAFAADLL